MANFNLEHLKQFRFKQLRRVLLHHDLALEIESGGEPKIFVGRPRKAVDAAMLAAAIRIDARLESDIRAVVPRDDRFRQVPEKLRLPPRLFLLFTGRIDLHDIRVAEIDVKFFKPVGRIPRSASSMDRRRRRRCLFDDGDKLLLGCFTGPGHVTSSHEHI